MTTTKVRTRRQKEHDRLAWMEGVKIIKPPQAIEGDVSPEDEGETTFIDEQPSQTVTRASSLVRGTDGGTVTAREGDDTERAESESRQSAATGTAVGKEVMYANLGEEITSVVRRFPRVTFEKVRFTFSLFSLLD
jgi:imidazolonepropionase-like amidohydrolase